MARARANGGWPRLPLTALSDIELLMVFEDAADGDGGASAIMVAERTDEGVRAARAIGGRFAWLKRWGYMEQDDDKRWFLTPEGEALRASTRSTAADRRALARLAERRLLAVGDELGVQLDDTGCRMLRRALQYREANR